MNHDPRWRPIASSLAATFARTVVFAAVAASGAAWGADPVPTGATTPVVTPSSASTESLDALKDALLCRGNPQGAVQRAARHATPDGDVLVGEFGDGAQARVVFLLREPLRVGGGPTRTIVHELTPSTPGFNGIVYGHFSGGHREVVKDLKLKPVPAGVAPTVGAFERALDKDVLGRKGAACPKTIGLTPLPGGGFLLGCGWCRG